MWERPPGRDWPLRTALPQKRDHSRHLLQQCGYSRKSTAKPARTGFCRQYRIAASTDCSDRNARSWYPGCQNRPQRPSFRLIRCLLQPLRLCISPSSGTCPQCADEVHVIGHYHGREQFHPLIAVKPMQRLQNDFRSPGIGKKRGTAIAARRQQVASARLATTPDAQSMRMRLVVHARQCAGHGGKRTIRRNRGLARVNPKPIAAGGRSPQEQGLVSFAQRGDRTHQLALRRRQREEGIEHGAIRRGHRFPDRPALAHPWLCRRTAGRADRRRRGRPAPDLVPLGR